jgi:hypothetical protein
VVARAIAAEARQREDIQEAERFEQIAALAEARAGDNGCSVHLTRSPA